MIKITCYRILIILSLLLITSACTNKPTTPPGDKISEGNSTAVPKEGIMFGSDRGGEFAYYLLDPNTREITKLNFGNLSVSTFTERPVWSPALKSYLIPIIENEMTDIYSIGWDGTNVRRLNNTPGIFEASPLPSPNGDWIAFIGSETENEIYAMRPDGSEVKNLTKFATPYSNMIWSPDGSTLFFISMRAGSPNIFSVKVNGTGLTNLSKGRGLDASFTLSPDGRTIAFDSDRQGMMDIFQMSAAGGEAANITNSPNTRDVEPIWSPDGQFIAFKSDIDGGSDIYVINLSDKTIKNLTNTPDTQESSISWTPDGRLIYVVSIDNQLEIFVVGLDGNPPENLTNNPANDYLPAWVNFD